MTDNKSEKIAHRLLSSPLVQSLAIGCITTLLATGLAAFQSLDWLDNRIGDWQLRQRAAPGKATSEIVTIIVDQNSLAEAEQLFGINWPWPRQIYAYILSFCQRAGVKAISFDLLFTENSSHGVEDDQLFADALGNSIPSVLAVPFGQRLGIATNWPPNLASITNAPQHLPRSLHRTWQQPTAAFPIAPLHSTTRLPGNVAATPDSDAVFRRVAPIAIFDDHLVPALGIATFLAATEQPSLAFTYQCILVHNLTIPIARNGRARLRYRGPSQTHRAISATAILQSELQIQENQTPGVDPASLKDTYVLIGLTAPGLMDLKPTPMGKTYPGVEIHATMLDNLLSEDFYTDIQPTQRFAISLVMAILAAWILRTIRFASFSILALPLFGASPVALAYALDPLNLWLPAGQPMTAVILASLAAMITNYALEGRQKRFIKGAFKQYLSPDVIEQLLQHPDALTLGGEERTLSIFFSDVQGFTSISETLSPQELTALLNEYLTAMTDIILAAGGTIDKYEGDAIIAFWNAPLSQPDHPARAVRAALECQRKLNEMRPHLKARYGKDMFARIGIHTGPVVVGNMGSNQRFDYTFLGDAGNLASRLEGVNKQFDSFLLISQQTRDLLPPDISVREIAAVRVVGKSTPITIFEPLLNPNDSKAFDEARRLFHNGNFTSAAAAFSALAPNDPVANRYAQRANDYSKNPPQNWAGTINLTDK